MSTEKKTINYNGMELECIDSGHWPKGVTLVMCDAFGQDVRFSINTILLHENIALYVEDGKRHNTGNWNYWAILPPKPAPRRLTNRELFDICQKGYAVLFNGGVFGYWNYSLDSEKNSCSDGVTGVRAPNSDEWLEPTSDLLEVEK